MKVTLVSHTPDPQKLIETCARISYDSKNEPFDPKVNSEFIRKLIKNGHESPLEHASATFLIEDVSRTCSHQIVRHRLASFSQRSQRYTDWGGCAGDHMRDYLREKYGDEIEYRMQQIGAEALNGYRELQEKGVSNEDARLILPECAATSLYMTANFREWRHFLELRMDRHAQWEIRGVACKVYEKLSEIAQDVFEDLAPEYQSNFVAGG